MPWREHSIVGTTDTVFTDEPDALRVSGEEVACDLLAGDVAYPAVVVDEQTRVAIHESWRNGQVHLVERTGRLTLATPGVDFTAPRVLDAVGRLARAVGAPPSNFQVRLRIAREGGGWDRGSRS